jgi:serine/threonine protein kinase
VDIIGVIVTDKLGDGTLGMFMKNKMSKKFQLEIIFQLIIVFLYIKKLNIIHGDIKADNFILKKNIEKKKVKFNNFGKYIIQPDYFIYPIDFGKSYNMQKDDDFYYLIELINNFPLGRSLYLRKEKMYSALNNPIFEDIFVDETCVIM